MKEDHWSTRVSRAFTRIVFWRDTPGLTYCAIAYDRAHYSVMWMTLEAFLNLAFIFMERNHCYRAWLRETKRAYPPYYEQDKFSQE